MRLPSLEDGCESSTGERTEPSHVVFECWERGSFEVLPEKDLGAGGRPVVSPLVSVARWERSRLS